MKQPLSWIWRQGIISTFLSGLFAILPIVLTVMIVAWVARYLYNTFAGYGAFGEFLYMIGLRRILIYFDVELGTTRLAASIIGWVVVLTSIWVLGVVVKSSARYRVDQTVTSIFERIPVINNVYNTSTQLVSMLRKEGHDELRSMSPVFCAFDQEFGGGALGLLTSADVYRIAQRDYYAVFLPSAPFFFSGRVLFVPVAWCTRVDMTVEQVMRIYISLGVLTHQVMPEGKGVPEQ